MKKIVYLIIISIFMSLTISWAGEKEDLQAKQKEIQQQIAQINSDFQIQSAMREKAVIDLTIAQNKIDQLRNNFNSLQKELNEINNKLSNIK